MAKSLERSPESKGKDILTPQSYLVLSRALLLKKIGKARCPCSRKQRQTDFNLLISRCQENFLEYFTQRRKDAKKNSRNSCFAFLRLCVRTNQYCQLTFTDPVPLVGTV